MLNKYSTLALLGAVSAGPAGPLPAVATYPKFATAVPPSTGASTADASGNVLDAYCKVGSNYVGLVRPFRNDIYVFPTQTIVRADQAAKSGATSTVGYPTGTTRTFYQTTTTQLGTYPAVVATGS